MAQKFKNQIDAQEGIKITNELYDGSNAAGTSGQVLSSTGTGTQWIDSSSETAERTEILVKNAEGSALVKGDPVYIVGGVGASARLEVGLCDASDSSKMPCVGLLSQNLAINGEGLAIVTGKLRNLITSPIDGVTPTENDTIYVKPGGSSGAALTTTKPTANNHLIQNVGQVGLVSTTASGNLVVSAIMRTNDVPNQIDRNVNFTDNSKLTFGDSTTPDLQIYHTANDASYIRQATAFPLIIEQDSSSTLELKSNRAINVYIDKNNDDTNNSFNILSNTETFNSSNVVFEVTQTGNVNIDGNVVADGSGTFDTLTLTSGNDNLTITQSGDDWTINNAQQNNGITIYDGTGGIGINYNGTEYFKVNSSGVYVPNNINFYVDTDTLYVDSTNEIVGINSTGNTNYKLYVNGKIASNNYIIAGLGTGGVALTHNDGYGNANLTFNHVSGVPEQDGNSFRIECNTDSIGNPAMIFELAANVTSGVAVSTAEKMRLDETGVKVRETGGGIIQLERNDASIVDGNPLGRLRFTGDDPVDGTFNVGAEIRGEAAGTWSTDNYPSELQFYTITTNTLGLALKLDSSQNATFAGDLTLTDGSLLITQSVGTETFKVTTAYDRVGKFVSSDANAFLAIQDSNSTDNGVGINVAGDQLKLLTGNSAGLTVESDQEIRFNAYGSGTFTGTSAYNLAVDSSGNIIETSGNIVDGSGTANYLTMWTDSDTIGNGPASYSSVSALTTFSSDLKITKSGIPKLYLYDNGNGGGGGAEAQIIFQNTAGNAIGIGYTNDNTSSSDLIISTDAGSTYGGYLDLSAAAISDTQADIILDPKSKVLVTKDLTITGDLIVNGTETILNTQTVEVEDNIIQLNTTQGSPDTATATTSGISIYRGDGVTQASFIFDDADDTWDLTNNLAIAGTVTIDGILLQDSADRSGLLEINRKGTTAWSGIQVKHGELWSWMGNGQYAGLYDDTRDDWIYLHDSDTGNTEYKWRNSTKMTITTGGMTMSGTITSRSITPETDSTYNIGTNTVRFANVYADNFHGLAKDLEVTSNDTFNDTYSLLWHDGADVYSSTWMTVTGSTDTFNVPNISTTGDITIGADSGGERKLIIHGGAGGSIEGGEIQLHLAADYDSTYAYYRIDAYADDFRIGREGETDILLDSNGDTRFYGRVGVNMAPESAYQFATYYNQTNPDDDFRFAHYINADFSGADNTTADREQGGIYMDIDSSADGDASNEHRLYGIYIDQRFTGYSDSVTGVYSRVESNNNTEKTANIQAMHGIAIHDSGVSGGVVSIHGGKFETYVEDDGDMDNSYGVFGRTLVNSTRAVNVDATYGGYFEIQTDSPNAITYGSMFGVRSTIDNNEGAVPTFGSQFLYYGDYQGTKGDNAYGLYITLEDKNYLSSNLGIGTDSPTGKFNSYISATRQLTHNGNGGDLSIISDNNSSPVMYIKGTGTADLLNVFDNTTEVFKIEDGGITTLTAEGYQLAIKDESSGNISEILTSNTAMGFFADRANAVASTSIIFSIDNSTKMTLDSSGATFSGNVIAEGNLVTRSINANLTISGDTSGNTYYNSASGEHRWRANGSSVNSMTLSSTLLLINENTRLNDNFKINLGTDSDLQLYHDSANSYIETSTSSAGDLYIKAQGTNHDLYLQAVDDIFIRPQGGENGIKVIGNGGVELYHDNSLVVATASNSVNISKDQLTFTNDAASSYVRAADALLIQSDYNGGEDKPIYLQPSAVTKFKVATSRSDFYNRVYISDNLDLNLWDSNGSGSAGKIHMPRAGAITFYGDESKNHSIMSVNASGTTADDIRINSYGAVTINLDSNNNNTSNADFKIGKHGSHSGGITDIFVINGETGNADFYTNGVGGVSIHGSGTGEGGHLTLKKASSYTYQWCIDNYQDNLRFFRENDDGTGGTVYANIASDGDLQIARYLEHYGDTNSYLGWSAADDFRIYVGGRELVRLDEGTDPDIAKFMTDEFRMYSDGTFHADGDIIAYSTTASSDKRLKKNIKPIDNALDIVDKLQGVHFNWKKDDKKSIGYIAQDVEKVLPEMVKEQNHFNDGSYKTVNYAAMVSVMGEAIKELRAEVEELKKQINGSTRIG